MEKSKVEKISSLNDGAVALLATIWNLGPTSRTQLAKVTGFPPSTITRLVRKLENANLVQEVGKGKSTGGREPKLLGLDPNAGQIVCMDLSGTKIKGGLVDATGNIVLRVTEKFLGYGEKILEAQITRMITQLLDQPEAKIRPTLGVGVAIPGTINQGFDTIRDSTFLGIKDYPIGRILSERLKIPTYVEHDTSAAALGEKYFGSGERQSDLVYITISNGIGAGIIIDDRIYRGTSGEAGELGHVTVERNGLLCPCGKRGCLETVASRPSIINNMRNLMMNGANTKLIDFVNNKNDEITLDMIEKAALENDKFVLEILRNAADYTALAIGSMTGILDIQLIIVGGEVAQLEAFMKPLESSISKYQFTNKEIKILPAALGNDATLKGVSVLSLQRLLNIQ